MHVWISPGEHCTHLWTQERRGCHTGQSLKRWCRCTAVVPLLFAAAQLLLQPGGSKCGSISPSPLRSIILALLALLAPLLRLCVRSHRKHGTNTPRHKRCTVRGRHKGKSLIFDCCFSRGCHKVESLRAWGTVRYRSSSSSKQSKTQKAGKANPEVWSNHDHEEQQLARSA